MEKKNGIEFLKGWFSITNIEDWKNARITCHPDNIILACEDYSEQQNQEQLDLLKEMGEALKGVLNIRKGSSGVAGYHMNGTLATWESFPEISIAQTALSKYDQLTKK